MFLWHIIKNISEKLYLKYEMYLPRIVSIFAVKRGLLLLRMDSIGDYLLFRNFLIEFKNSNKYNNITLIGDSRWSDLAETFDSKVIDNFIWIERGKFEKNRFYRLKQMCLISSYKFDAAIYPTYSRDPLCDWLMHSIRAKTKIASTGDLSNISEEKRLKGNQFYTKLIPADSGVMFEYFRNLEFVTAVLEKKLLTRYSITKCSTQYSNCFDHHVLLFIGASIQFRKWKLQNFLELAAWINENYKYKTLLCGGNYEQNDINGDLPDYITNLINKTTLPEMIDIISQSKFVLSNETSIPHMCAGLDITVFVLSNGNHFGRFTPYPQSITSKYHPIFPPEIARNLANYGEMVNLYGYGSTLDINEIGVEQVKKKIIEIFPIEQKLNLSDKDYYDG